MRLITFSLFGDNPLYCVGAVENAKIARVIYPEWTARFYVAQDVPEHYIEEIKNYGAEVVRCEKKNSHFVRKKYQRKIRRFLVFH